MSTLRSAWIVCDECGSSHRTDYGCPTVEQARQEARDYGWKRRTVGGRRVDICDGCIEAAASRGVGGEETTDGR